MQITSVAVVSKVEIIATLVNYSFCKRFIELSPGVSELPTLGLAKMSEVIRRRRRLKFAGHCYRATRECALHVMFWQLSHGTRGSDKSAKMYVDCLLEDRLCCGGNEISHEG